MKIGKEKRNHNYAGKKNEITPKQSGNSYITLSESGHTIEDQEEATEHRCMAQFFENIYQTKVRTMDREDQNSNSKEEMI